LRRSVAADRAFGNCGRRVLQRRKGWLDLVEAHVLSFANHLLRDEANSLSLGNVEGLDAGAVDGVFVGRAPCDLARAK
jgi:hypothetical protein